MLDALHWFDNWLVKYYWYMLAMCSGSHQYILTTYAIKMLHFFGYYIL